MPPVEAMLSQNIVEASRKIKSELEVKAKQIQMFRAIQKRIKAMIPDPGLAFKQLDSNEFGYLVLRDFHMNFSHLFDLSLKNEEVRALFNEIDSDENGLIKYVEFENFYHVDYIRRLAAIETEKQQSHTMNEIFDHLIKVLKQKGLTLLDCFDQIDDDKNGYIEVDEFHNMLESMGFTITQAQVYEIMMRMDDNFDGKISYSELKHYIESLGFNMAEFEARGGNIKAEEDVNDAEAEYMWRDKALELVIRVLKAAVGKSMSFSEYFAKYDNDHDAHLSPA